MRKNSGQAAAGRYAHICCVHALRQLVCAPRAWMVLILAFLFFENQFVPIRAMLIEENMRIDFLGLLTYLLSDPVVSLFSSLFLLMLLFDVPVHGESLRYTVLRTGRGAWARGQIRYILAATLLYLLALCLIVLALTLPWAQWSVREWSSGLVGMARQGMYEAYDSMLDYDPWLMRAYTPLTGALLSLVLRFFGLSALGLLMCALNVAFRSRLGFLVAMLPVLLDSIAGEFFSEGSYYLLPMTLTRLTALDYGDGMGRPPLLYALVALPLLVLLMWRLSLWILRKGEVNL